MRRNRPIHVDSGVTTRFPRAGPATRPSPDQTGRANRFHPEKGKPMQDNNIELYSLEDMTLEELPEGNALGSWFSAATASTASCPGSSAASVGSASTFG